MHKVHSFTKLRKDEAPIYCDHCQRPLRYIVTGTIDGVTGSNFGRKCWLSLTGQPEDSLDHEIYRAVMLAEDLAKPFHVIALGGHSSHYCSHDEKAFRAHVARLQSRNQIAWQPFEGPMTLDEFNAALEEVRAAFVDANPSDQRRTSETWHGQPMRFISHDEVERGLDSAFRP